jgi:thiol-disulfide isomerase/thioredoxin
MQSVTRTVRRIAVLLLLSAGIIGSLVTLFHARNQIAEAERFSEATVNWEREGRYYNPIDSEAVLLNFAPQCGSCRIEIEELAEIAQQSLPIVGISVRPYPEAEVEFAATITGHEAERLQLLYGLTLDTVVHLQADGTVIAQKPPRQSTAQFYRNAAGARL